MSVCLAVTKGIAVSSLGLYAGLLTTTTIISASKATAVIIASLDIITETKLEPVIATLINAAAVLGSLATGFFAASYFGSPVIWRHPYLLYGTFVAPLTSVYLYILQNNLKQEAVLQGTNKSQNESITLSDEIDDSVVDLGIVKDQHDQDAVVRNVAAKCSRVAKHLGVAALISIVGFSQSVIGIYGEGQFV